jgi:uncharacterized protein (DUF433 family)
MVNSLESFPTASSLGLPLEEVVWTSPDRLSGAPCFTRSRVPVKALFDYLEGGQTIDTFLSDFEGVSRAQALAAIYYGKARLMPPGTPQPTGTATVIPQSGA